MFKNRFNLLHEKLYLISFFITFLSLFLPWIIADNTIDRFEILGIYTLLNSILIGFLLLNTILSVLMQNKMKLVSINNLVLGIICFIIVLITYIGYHVPLSLTFGVIHFGIGIYIALIGTIGIAVSGILGLKENRK